MNLDYDNELIHGNSVGDVIEEIDRSDVRLSPREQEFVNSCRNSRRRLSRKQLDWLARIWRRVTP